MSRHTGCSAAREATLLKAMWNCFSKKKWQPGRRRTMAAGICIHVWKSHSCNYTYDGGRQQSTKQISMLWPEAGNASGTLQLRWQARLMQHLGAAVILSQHGQQLNATFHHCALSDPPFSGPFLLNHLLIAQHFPVWVHIPSLFEINRTTQIRDGRTVSEREPSLTPRLHASNFEIRLPPDLPRQH